MNLRFASLIPISHTTFNPGKRNILPALNPETFQNRIAASAWGRPGTGLHLRLAKPGEFPL
jgi:hypothetical protein